MSISDELMLAILAMDSYNSGYDAGIGDGQNVVNGIDEDGLGGEGSRIGSALVTSQSDVDSGTPGVTAGFYAVAYQWNGETVISYRGTDNANPLAEGSNSWNGWTPGGGDFGSAVVIPGPRPRQA